MPRVELLAPGGTFTKAQYALDFGADAVYCGTNFFAMRQHKGNFTFEQLAEIIRYAHERRKKVYVTMNIFAHNYHLNTVTKALEKLRGIGPDALIVSDPGVFTLVREQAPELPIHISTQANITNAAGVRFWKQLGAERIILAREVGLKEIRDIHSTEPDVELETFVHGAQCMAYSGRCMLSAYMTNSRKANLGSCCNSCRWKYTEVEEEQRPGEKIRVEEDEFGTYIFNAHDMCMIEHVEEVVNAGVVSLKIEGRGRSEFYVASVVKAYREALSLVGDHSEAATERLRVLQEELLAASAREYDTGFFFGPPSQNITKRKKDVTHIFVGVLSEHVRDNTADFIVKNEIYHGEQLHVLTPDDEYEFTPEQLINEKTGKAVASLHGGQGDVARLTLPRPVHPRTILWAEREGKHTQRQE